MISKEKGRFYRWLLMKQCLSYKSAHSSAADSDPSSEMDLKTNMQQGSLTEKCLLPARTKQSHCDQLLFSIPSPATLLWLQVNWVSGIFLGTNSFCPSVPGRTRKVATLVWKREDTCSPHRLKYTESRTCSFIHKISTGFFWDQKHGPSYMALSRNGNLFPLGMAFRTLIRKVKNKLGSEGSMLWEASRNLPLHLLWVSYSTSLCPHLLILR